MSDYRLAKIHQERLLEDARQSSNPSTSVRRQFARPAGALLSKLSSAISTVLFIALMLQGKLKSRQTTAHKPSSIRRA